MRSILSRRISDDALKWAFSFGIEEAEGPVRLPANAEIGAEARVCIPLRARGVLLGFMFIVDPDESLGPAQLAQAEEAAGEAAHVLYRERRLRELERERERWLLTHLLTGTDAGEAARALADEGFLDAERAAVLVVRADSDPASQRDRRRRRARPPAARRPATRRAGAAPRRSRRLRQRARRSRGAVAARARREPAVAGRRGGRRDRHPRRDRRHAPAGGGRALVPPGARRRRRRPARGALRARGRLGRARRLPDARAVPGRPRRRRAAPGADRRSCATAPTRSWWRRSRPTSTGPAT